MAHTHTHTHTHIYICVCVCVIFASRNYYERTPLLLRYPIA